MNIQGILGIKLDQKQAFLENGNRVPVTLLSVKDATITQVKTTEKDGYSSVQIGMGSKNRTTKALQGHIKKAGLTKTPRFLKEIRVGGDIEVAVGDKIAAEDVLKVGDIVNVTGTSKGKGYAGVVKKWNFRGGPKTHGQSDRERAPGSIGQSATPGRVYRGKKMSGRMGNEQVTIKNLQVLDVQDGIISLLGLVPGIRGAVVTVSKISESNNFIPLLKDVDEVVAEEVVEEVQAEAAVEEEVADAKEEVTTASEEVTEAAEEVSEAKEEVKEEAENADK